VCSSLRAKCLDIAGANNVLSASFGSGNIESQAVNSCARGIRKPTQEDNPGSIHQACPSSQFLRPKELDLVEDLGHLFG
jgi:hypothetical protein